MVGSKVLSRIVGRYLEMNGMTVEQAISAVDESPKKPGVETISVKLEQLNLEWEAKTDLCLEFVLDSYPSPSLLY